jgi:hypothetical protein
MEARLNRAPALTGVVLTEGAPELHASLDEALATHAPSEPHGGHGGLGLENQGMRMGYAEARAQALPLGSGNVEATCKCLVGFRMNPLVGGCGTFEELPRGERWWLMQERPVGLEPYFSWREWMD